MHLSHILGSRFHLILPTRSLDALFYFSFLCLLPSRLYSVLDSHLYPQGERVFGDGQQLGDLRGKKSGKREKERGEDYFEGVLRLAFKDLRFWKRRDFFRGREWRSGFLERKKPKLKGERVISGEEKNKEKGDRDSLRETKKRLCLGGAFQVRFFL